MNINELHDKLKTIGSDNEKIREETFEYWHTLRENNQLNKQQYLFLLAKTLELIMVKIEEPKNNYVITRSYSLLLLDCLLQADLQYNIFVSKQLDDVCDELIIYMKTEEDWRGIEKDNGCVHNLAHLTDCIFTISKNSKITQIKKQKILDELFNLIDIAQCDYRNLEDERIARAISGFSDECQEQVVSWIKSIKCKIEESKINNKRYDVNIEIFKYRLLFKALLRYETYNQILIEQLDDLY